MKGSMAWYLFHWSCIVGDTPNNDIGWRCLLGLRSIIIYLFPHTNTRKIGLVTMMEDGQSSRVIALPSDGNMSTFRTTV